MRFFTSDWHLGHSAVLGFENRPFDSLDHMTQVLIDNWNERVDRNDIGYFLGDISFYGTKQTREIIDQLNGTKILVRGNHDPKAGSCINSGFDMVCDEMDIPIFGKRVTLSHYPFKCDRFPKRVPIDSRHWLLHGHVHGKQRRVRKMIHVGVDAWDFKPVSETYIGLMMNQVNKKGIRNDITSEPSS